MHSLPICFSIWKLPQASPLSSPHQAWPKEKTWLLRGQCSLDFLLILPPLTPTYTLDLHIALGYSREGSRLLIPTRLKPACLRWSSPPFPTYNSIERRHNLSISLARPSGLRGLEMETGFVCQLTAVPLWFLAERFYISRSEHLRNKDPCCFSRDDL